MLHQFCLTKCKRRMTSGTHPMAVNPADRHTIHPHLSTKTATLHHLLVHHRKRTYHTTQERPLCHLLPTSIARAKLDVTFSHLRLKCCHSSSSPPYIRAVSASPRQCSLLCLCYFLILYCSIALSVLPFVLLFAAAIDCPSVRHRKSLYFHDPLLHVVPCPR